MKATKAKIEQEMEIEIDLGVLTIPELIELIHMVTDEIMLREMENAE